MRTHGERFESALACNTPEEARAYLEREVEDFMQDPSFHGTSVDAQRIILNNLAYLSTSYDKEAEAKIKRLFSVENPVSGHILIVPAANWQIELPALINSALDGDTIIVHSTAMKELAERAHQRMCPAKYLIFIVA